MLKEFSLEGKVAIVTGALGLIGKEHCRGLAEAGANVVVTDLDDAKCKEFAQTLSVESIGVGADITKEDSVAALLGEVMKKWGHVDVLVNNAAINEKFENPEQAGEQSKFENFPLDMFRESIEVNVIGMFICSKIIGSQMAKQGKGSIINIASTYGIVGPDQSIYIDENGEQKFYKTAAYPTTKGAVLNFTRFLAAYWGKSGIRVNTLSPGGVQNNQDPHFIKLYSQKTPLNRMSKASEYQGGVVYLASDASSYVTGSNLVIDGGWTAW